MKKHKLLALILALTFVFGLIAGCGAESAASAPETETTSASAPEAPEAPEAPAEEPAEEASAVETSLVEEPVEEPAADPRALMAEEYISYPLEGGETITMWYYQPPYSTFVDSNSKFNCIDDAEAATGVTLEIMEVPSSTASEQFNMMIASGDMCDLLPCSEYYTAGLSKAYEEEIIVDINEYVDEFMPNFAAVRAALPESTQNDTLTDGMMLSFVSIADGALTQNGLVTRADWLDALGISFEGEQMSLDDFTDLLRTLHNEYETPYTYYMTATTTLPVGAAFDISVPTLMGDGFMTSVGMALFHRDNQIVSAWTDDGFREYLEYALDLMDEGVLYKDFMSMEEDRMVQNTAQGTGQVAVWTAAADKIEEIAGYSDDPNIAFVGLPVVSADPTSTYLWAESPSLVTNSFSLSSTCENPEIVCQWENYFWTEAGSLMVNYGVDGESLTWEGDEPRFDWQTPVTALGVNAPNSDMALELFTMKRFATSYMDNDRLLPTFTDVAMKAVELWTMEDTECARQLPQKLSKKTVLTTEETEELKEYEADLLTYASEYALKFLEGAWELNDENWAEYVETIESMGLDNILTVYQNAYDELLAGER